MMEGWSVTRRWQTTLEGMLALPGGQEAVVPVRGWTFLNRDGAMGPVELDR